MSDNNYYGSTGNTFQQCPTGNHAAILIKIVDLGTQEGEYKGEPTSRRQELWTWELPNELMEDGQPFIISKFYTASLGDKSNLFKDLTSWLGKTPERNLDPETMIGKACQLSVVAREGSDKHVVSSVASLAKGITLPKKPHNPTVFFSLRGDRYNEETFESLSEGIQNMIRKSPEYAAIINGPDETTPDNSDIPF